MRTQADRDDVTVTIASGLVVFVLVAAAVFGLGLLADATGTVSLDGDGLWGASVLAGVVALVGWTGRAGQVRRRRS